MFAMRRVFAGFTLAIVLVSSALIAVGCGGLTSLGGLERLFPPGTFGSGTSSPFIGQFMLTSISVNGASANCPGALTQNSTTYTCEAIVRTFTADGTFNDTSPADQVGSGTWAVSGSSLTITKGGNVQVGTAMFTADASQFIVTIGVENYTWTKQ